MRIFVATLLVVAVITQYEPLKNLDVRALVGAAANLAAAVAVVLLIYCVKALVFVIPAMLIYVAVGMAFSPGLAIAVNLTGILLEVCITYLLGRFLGGDAVEKRLSQQKYAQLLQKIRGKYEKLAIFLIRLLPVFPIDFVSLLLGAAKEPFALYLLLSVVGIAPRVILFTLLGEAAYAWIPMEYVAVAVLVAVPIVVAVWIIRYAQRDKG